MFICLKKKTCSKSRAQCLVKKKKEKKIDTCNTCVISLAQAHGLRDLVTTVEPPVMSRICGRLREVVAYQRSDHKGEGGDLNFR